MKPSATLEAHRTTIRDIILAHRATNPRVFGSVACERDRDDSDLDILVDILPGTTLFDLGALQEELESMLGIHVDVLTPQDLPERFRQTVLKEAKPL